MGNPAWLRSLQDDFGADTDVVQALESNHRNEVKRAVKAYLTKHTDETQRYVLQLLESLEIPSTLVTLTRRRLAKLRIEGDNQIQADQQGLEEDGKQLQKVLDAAKWKFGLDCSPYAVNMANNTLKLGGGYVFHFQLKNDNVDWLLYDDRTGHVVQIYAGDATEDKLTNAMLECQQKRDDMMRGMVPAPKNKREQSAQEEEDPPLWQGSYEEKDEKADGEPGAGTA